MWPSPSSAAAGVGGGSGAAERQAFKFRDTPISTTSTVFQDIPGLSGLVICADEEASVSISLGATGAPVGMRVMVDEEQIAHHGPTHFEPASGTTSFSFAFAVNLGPFEGNDHDGVDVQWRSTTGANVTLNLGLINVIYEKGTRQCP